MTDQPWHTAPLVAVDLEGSGAQDRDAEAILEIALVPLINAVPVPDGAYSTLVNPERGCWRRDPQPEQPGPAGLDASPAASTAQAQGEQGEAGEGDGE